MCGCVCLSPAGITTVNITFRHLDLARCFTAFLLSKSIFVRPWVGWMFWFGVFFLFLLFSFCWRKQWVISPLKSRFRGYVYLKPGILYPPVRLSRSFTSVLNPIANEGAVGAYETFQPHIRGRWLSSEVITKTTFPPLPDFISYVARDVRDKNMAKRFIYPIWIMQRTFAQKNLPASSSRSLPDSSCGKANYAALFL